MSKLKKYLLTLAVPLVLAVAGLAWMFDLSGGAGDNASYETSEASRGAIRRLVSTSGPVRALVTVQVGSQLSGNIRELRVDFNSEVKVGDILAVLDEKSYRARVAAAEADLAIAKANLANQRAAMDKAAAVERQAQAAIVRQRTLAKRGITSAVALEQAERDAEVARADINVMKAQIDSAQAQIIQREAALDQARIDLDRTQIRSPIDGTVISRTVDIGQTVAASLQAPELFQIAQDLRRIRIEAQVNEADVGAIAADQAVSFSVDAYPDRTFTGRVKQVRLAATELENVVTYTVIIEADNADRKLYPGMTANALIETARKDDVLRVSSDALRFKPRNVTVDRDAQMANRRQQMVERLQQSLSLSQEQTAAVAAQLDVLFKEMSAARSGAGRPSFGASPAAGRGAGNPGGSGGGGRSGARIEQIVASVVTDEQRPAFEAWKASRAQQAARRTRGQSATVWVLNADNAMEPRFIRVGLSDDQFTEVLGRGLKEGDKVVTRTRRTTGQ